ncbi:MAG TPA: Ig-like domain-containing protein, partial [Herpetosiphonaceae bacterium]
FDGIGAEGCSTAPSGCTGLRIEVSSGSPTIAIYSSTFRNIASNAVAVIASGTADLTLLTHTSLFTDNGVYATVPNTGIYLSASGNATVNQSVAQSSFSNLSQAAVHTISGGAAIVNTSVVSNVISNMTGASPGVIALETASGAGSAPTLSAQIADNQLSSVAGDGISVNYQSPGGALSLNSRDNIINNVDPAQPKHGISIRSAPGAQGDMTVTAIGNQISSTGGSGIRADVADLGAQVNLRANNLSDNNQANGNDAAIFLRGGSGSTGGAAFNVRGAIIGNTIPAAGVRLGEYATASLQLEATGPSAEDYIAANNTFSGGGTVALLPVSNPIGTLALGSVPTLIENLHPAAYADGSLTPITVPNSIASTINVLGNDAAGDPGDSVHLWTFSGVSARGGVISRNDNGTPGNLTDDRLTYTPLPTETGLDRFYYVVRDNGGRSAIAQVVLNLVADSTPPDTTITTPPGNPSNDTTPTFQFTGTDNVTPPGSLAFQCRLYLTSATPPAFASCTSPSTSAALPDGSYTFQVRAVDQAGNIDPTPASYTWQIDSTGPTTTINTTPANPTNSASANFTFSASDGTGSGVAGFSCSLDGAAFTACTSPQSYAGLADGSHTFRVRATDNAGNTGAIASYTWTVDTAPPDTTITANPTALSNSSTATFQFTGNALGGAAIAGFECSLDGGAFIACASPRVYTGLADGSHTFAVRAIDAAGNVDATPATFTWTVDTTPPPAPVTNTPANGSVTNNPLPPVTGSAEPSATVNIFIDGSVVGNTTADASGSWSYAPTIPLGNGPHTTRARAADAAGNVSVDSNTNTFTVDTVEPDTTFTVTPPAATNSTSANFSFIGAGTGSVVARFECSLDGVAYATCASPQNLSGLAEGAHTFRVRAVDAAGNTDTSPASYAWTVDLTAADTTITGNPPALSASANATFSFTGNDPTSGGVASGVAGFECSLDGGAFTTCASGLTLTGLSDGAHTFAVRAIDAAGNVDASPASFTWLIDTTPAQV